MAKKKKEPRSRGETLGGMYRAASTGAILVSPVAVKFFAGGERDPIELAKVYQTRAGDVIGSLGVHALDQMIGQKVFNHNSALGRGSLTAWAPEVFASAIGLNEGRRTGHPGGFTAGYTLAKTGFSPDALSGAQFGRAEPRAYFGLKIAGGVIRKASNMGVFRSVFKPVKKMLSAAGGAL